LADAINQNADIFITSDVKYHEFFDADKKIILADIGHFESEQFTIDLLYEFIKKNFSIFAAHYTKVNTNPVNYL
jgi:putative NIF3 family GTP cyclohydrolase 1 type 2